MDFLSSKGGKLGMNSDNFKVIKKVLWVILFANLMVAILKIIIGNLINSTSMIADGFHSLTDGSSNIVGIIGINLASKPIDVEHPYGHKKFEMLAGLFIAGMLLVIGGKVIINAVYRLINPIELQITVESIVTLMFTIIVNVLVCRFEFRQGKKMNSYILTSDSLHTKSDIFVSAGVLFTLISVKLGFPPIIDSIASFIVSIFILHSSYEIFKSASEILVDKAAVETDAVKEIILSFNEVKDVHKIRSRGIHSEIYLDMHMKLAANMNVAQCHKLIKQIENKVREEVNGNIQMIVHVEPFYDSGGVTFSSELI